VRRAGLIAGAVLLVLAGGWTALWFAGRGEVAALLDAEIARLEARGTTVEYATREIGGFPAGYTVALTEVVATTPEGHVARLPRLDASVALADPDRLTLRLPPEARLELAATAGRLAGPIAIESEDARLVLDRSPAGGGAREARLEAASLTAVRAEADATEAAPTSGAVTLADLEAVLTEPAPGEEGAARRLLARAARLDALASAPAAVDGTRDGRVRMDARLAEPFVSADLPERLGPAPEGRVELRTGLLHLDLARDDTDEAPGGRTTATAARLSLAAAREAGVLDGTLSLDEVSLLAAPTDPEARLSGALAAGRVEIGLVEPVARTAAAQPFEVRVLGEAIEPDEELWTALDPGRALAREPIRLDAAITGRTREGRAPTGTAIEDLGEAEARLLVELLGARVEGEGRLVVPPAGVDGAPPARGEARLVLEDSMALLRDLAAAGYLSPSQAQLGMILADNYARPGETPSTLIVEVAVADGMVSINGTPVAPVEALPLPR
jgi:hypothetical protein